MRDRVVGGENSLLACLCMIRQLCFATGLWEFLGIEEMIEDTNTTILGLIRDAITPLARQARKGANFLDKMYESQTEAVKNAKAAETDKQTMTTQTSDAESISSSPSMIQSVLPRPRGMPSGFLVISQAMQTKEIMILSTLEDKVWKIKRAVKPWVDTQFV